jgi:hypothetical protein
LSIKPIPKPKENRLEANSVRHTLLDGEFAVFFSLAGLLVIVCVRCGGEGC